MARGVAVESSFAKESFATINDLKKLSFKDFLDVTAATADGILSADDIVLGNTQVGEVEFSFRDVMGRSISATQVVSMIQSGTLFEVRVGVNLYDRTGKQVMTKTVALSVVADGSAFEGTDAGKRSGARSVWAKDVFLNALQARSIAATPTYLFAGELAAVSATRAGVDIADLQNTIDMTFVAFTDKQGLRISDSLTAADSFAQSKAGEYEITFTNTLDGVSATKTIFVTVLPEDAEEKGKASLSARDIVMTQTQARAEIGSIIDLDELRKASHMDVFATNAIGKPTTPIIEIGDGKTVHDLRDVEDITYDEPKSYTITFKVLDETGSLLISLERSIVILADKNWSVDRDYRVGVGAVSTIQPESVANEFAESFIRLDDPQTNSAEILFGRNYNDVRGYIDAKRIADSDLKQKIGQFVSLDTIHQAYVEGKWVYGAYPFVYFIGDRLDDYTTQKVLVEPKVVIVPDGSVINKSDALFAKDIVVRQHETENLITSSVLSRMETFAVRGYEVLNWSELDVKVYRPGGDELIGGFANDWYARTKDPYYKVVLKAGTVEIERFVYVVDDDADIDENQNTLFARSVTITTDDASSVLSSYKDLYTYSFNRVSAVVFSTDSPKTSRYFSLSDNATDREKEEMARIITSSLENDHQTWEAIASGTVGNYGVKYSVMGCEREVVVHVVPKGQEGGDENNYVWARPATVESSEAKKLVSADVLYAPYLNDVSAIVSGRAIETNIESSVMQYFGERTWNTLPNYQEIADQKDKEFAGKIKKGLVGTYPQSYFITYEGQGGLAWARFATSLAVVPDDSTIYTEDLTSGARYTGSVYARSVAITKDIANHITDIRSLLAINPNGVVTSASGVVYQTQEELLAGLDAGTIEIEVYSGDIDEIKNASGKTFMISYRQYISRGNDIYVETMANLTVLPDEADVSEDGSRAIWATSVPILAQSAKDLARINPDPSVLYGPE